MNIKQKLTRLKWQIVNSDHVRYFHLSHWPVRIYYGLQFGATIATLLVLFVGFAWYQYDLTPHFPTFIGGIPLAFFIGFIFGLARR